MDGDPTLLPCGFPRGPRVGLTPAAQTADGVDWTPIHYIMSSKPKCRKCVRHFACPLASRTKMMFHIGAIYNNYTIIPRVKALMDLDPFEKDPN